MDGYLIHHGIKDQKWGVRRYQNPDGSLTEEGYRHYGLNPDGSRSNRRSYSDSTRKGTSKGMAIGIGAGVAAGTLIGGPAAIAVGALIGQLSGASIGTAVGAINTSVKRRKIQRLLSQNGKVYVNDI